MTFTPFLRAFVIAFLVLVGGSAAILLSCGADFPAPHLSTSPSFNEKAKWLRRTLADNDGRCDTVVVGSSMALNAIDGPQLAGAHGRVINIASFGIGPEESLRILEPVLARCRPKTILMATYHGDLTQPHPEDKGIDWPAFDRYARGGPDWRAYAAQFDPYYLLERSFKAWQLHRGMAWDQTGSVKLACDGRDIERARWNGYLQEPFGPPRPAALAALGRIAALAEAGGGRFVVAVVPLRPEVEAHFRVAERAALWRTVGSAIAPFGGVVVRPAGNATFRVPDFVDFAHLNYCGAQRWTGMVLADLARQGTAPGR